MCGKQHALVYVTLCIHQCLCVQENLSCLELIYNPSDYTGHLSSCLHPFTWPRWTTGQDKKLRREGGVKKEANTKLQYIKTVYNVTDIFSSVRNELRSHL